MRPTDTIGIYTVIALVAAITVYGFRKAKAAASAEPAAAPVPVPVPVPAPVVPAPVPAGPVPAINAPELLGGRSRKNTFRRRRGVITKNVRRTRYRKNRSNRSHSNSR